MITYSKRLFTTLFTLVVFTFFLFGCNNANNNDEILFTNLVTPESQKELKEILQKSGISNIEDFFNNLEEFNSVQRQTSGLVSNLTPIHQKNYNLAEINNAYTEKYPNKNDSNCRLIAFELLKENIQVKEMPETYGNYLMFDIDAIENDIRYISIKDKKSEFIALFDQIPLYQAQTGDFEEILSKSLQSRSVKFPNNKVSLIRVALYDPDEKVLFFGHAGILIKYDNYYWFLEKLAPGEPYQFTRYFNKSQLVIELQSRPHYSDADSPKPIIVENNDILQ